MTNEEITFIKETLIKLQIIITNNEDHGMSSDGYRAIMNFRRYEAVDKCLKILTKEQKNENN